MRICARQAIKRRPVRTASKGWLVACTIVGTLLFGSLAITSLFVPLSPVLQIISYLVYALGALAMPIGICVGVVGLAMVSVNYFIYKSILKRRKDKYRAEILELSSRILGE